MEPVTMPATYQQGFVALSFAIAFIGAFVALTASARILGPGGRVNRVNLAASAVALGGVGIWSMHFIGMLALKVEMGVSYAMVETLVSLLAAVGSSALALLWVARNPGSVSRILGAGVLLGAGVGGMHYLGMHGMRFAGYIDWAARPVVLSMVIAVVAATAALWLAFAVRRLAARGVAALVMAAAVCAMHYTGMEAASFICTSPNPSGFPQGFGLITSLELPALVSTLALGMAVVIFIDQMFQRLSGSARRMPVPVRPAPVRRSPSGWR